jgi:hypothetical protein
VGPLPAAAAGAEAGGSTAVPVGLTTLMPLPACQVDRGAGNRRSVEHGVHAAAQHSTAIQLSTRVWYAIGLACRSWLPLLGSFPRLVTTIATILEFSDSSRLLLILCLQATMLGNMVHNTL